MHVDQQPGLCLIEADSWHVSRQGHATSSAPQLLQARISFVLWLPVKCCQMLSEIRAEGNRMHVEDALDAVLAAQSIRAAARAVTALLEVQARTSRHTCCILRISELKCACMVAQHTIERESYCIIKHAPIMLLLKHGRQPAHISDACSAATSTGSF